MPKNETVRTPAPMSSYVGSGVFDWIFRVFGNAIPEAGSTEYHER